MLKVVQGEPKLVIKTKPAPTTPPTSTKTVAAPATVSEHGQGGGSASRETGRKPAVKETQAGYAAPAAAQPTSTDPAPPQKTPTAVPSGVNTNTGSASAALQGYTTSGPARPGQSGYLNAPAAEPGPRVPIPRIGHLPGSAVAARSGEGGGLRGGGKTPTRTPVVPKAPLSRPITPAAMRSIAPVSGLSGGKSGMIAISRTTSPEFAGRGELVLLTKDVTVYRYYGGAAEERGNMFLLDPGNVFTPEAAATYLGSSMSVGNTHEMKVAATIPAGTVIKVGLSKPNRPSGRAGSWLGGGVVVQLDNPSQLGALTWGSPSWLPSDGGNPWGDGPDGHGAGP